MSRGKVPLFPQPDYLEVDTATGKELDQLVEQYGLSRQYSVDDLMSKESTVPTTPVNDPNSFLQTKFFVGDAAQSKAIQQHLFSLDFSWNGEKVVKAGLVGDWIFINCGGLMSYCTCERTFQASNLKEVKFLFKPVQIEVVYGIHIVAPPRETFLYEGKKYFKDELDKAFSSLTPVPTDWIR